MKTTKFKHSEVGPIPEEWEVKRLGEIGDVVTGSTPPRDDMECWGGNYNWISAKDFKDKYIVDSEEKVTTKGMAFCRLLPSDSVLVTCIASIGLNAIAKNPCATNQQINAVICKACNNEYLYYQIEAAKDRMIELAGQTAVPIINKGDFENLMIPVPPRPEQEKIAEALSDMDALLAAMTKLIEKNRAIKQGTMQQLLTGKRRLAGFTGKWVEKRIGDMAEVATGATPSTLCPEFWGGDIRWMSSGELNDKIVSEVVGRITKAGFDACSTHMVPVGCVLIGLAGQGKTRGTAAYNLVELCTNQSIAAILPNASFDSRFLYYYMDRQYEELRLLSAGDGGRGGLTKGQIENFFVTIPPTNVEQHAISIVLSDMDAEIMALEAKLSKYESIKQGMMQELLTGKTSLSV